MNKTLRPLCDELRKSERALRDELTSRDAQIKEQRAQLAASVWLLNQYDALYGWADFKKFSTLS